MRIADVVRMFPGTRWERRETSSGSEIVLEFCPLDLKGLGSEHPRWKVYVNPEKEVLKCFVCHGPGRGMRLETAQRKSRRGVSSHSRIIKDMRRGLKELPPIPDKVHTIRECFELDAGHPACLYLCERGVSVPLAEEVGMLWKDKGVASWQKPIIGSLKDDVGTYPGLIIPIVMQGKLKGWQLCAVPRGNQPKYVTAPGSRIAGTLYNIDAVLGKSDTVVIVEGVFDALRLPNMAVALLTDNITDKKVRLLSTGNFREVVLCLDSDRTEQHVKKEWIKLQGLAPSVRMVQLPIGDPADYEPDDLCAILFD